MSDLNGKSFTIRISELPDGTLDVWSKGMPDTRTFGGMDIADVPRTHRLGLFGLGEIIRAGEANGWVEAKPESDEGEKL